LRGPAAIPSRSAKRASKTPTFEEAATAAHQQLVVVTSRNRKHAAQWLSTLRTYAFPSIGARAVHSIEQSDVLRVLSPIWTERPETARRVRQRVRTVLDWAKAAGYRDGVNPVDGVEKGLPKRKPVTSHSLALPRAELPDLMSRLADIRGIGALALRFLILTAARSGEVRAATWNEFDIEGRVWTIPAIRMKAGKEHRVPFSEAAVDVLRLAKANSSAADTLVFPSSKPGRPLLDMTLSAVLKRLGIPATVHGFCSTFRDWAEEATAFPHEVKEAALAHSIKNRDEAAYRRSDLFEKRRAMMDAWAQFAVRAATKVIPFRA